MKTYCISCCEEMKPREDEEELCNKCFADNQEAIKDYEAEKEMRNRNQHWDC